MDSIQKKLVDEKRGDYFHEQNLLFLHALKTIGFDARGLTGRVILSKSVDAITSRTHMLVLINLNAIEYICDTGFGTQVLTSPIKLHTEKSQKTSHEDYRILKIKDGYVLQSSIKGKWYNLYKFDLQEQYLVDYKLGNWYTSTHPNSDFTKDLITARIGNNSRYIVSND